MAFEDSPEIMSSRNDGMSVPANLNLAYTIGAVSLNTKVISAPVSLNTNNFRFFKHM